MVDVISRNDTTATVVITAVSTNAAVKVVAILIETIILAPKHEHIG